METSSPPKSMRSAPTKIPIPPKFSTPRHVKMVPEPRALPLSMIRLSHPSLFPGAPISCSLSSASFVYRALA